MGTAENFRADREKNAILIPEPATLPIEKKVILESRARMELRKSRLSKSELIGELSGTGYDALMIDSSSFVVDGDVIEAGRRKLRIISINGTGTDNIDLDAAKRNGVLVCNVPGYADVAVAEMVFALLLSLARNIVVSNENTRAGLWRQAGYAVGSQLKGKTIGVIGVGKIGTNVCRIARGFGLEVLAYDSVRSSSEYDFVSVDELLSRSDFITLHLPLDESTVHFLDREKLLKTKNGAIVINTGRGKLLDQSALVEFLRSGRIRGAGLDVFAKEPVTASDTSSPLFGDDIRDKVILTPHIAYATEVSMKKLYDTWCDNVISFFDGQPQNAVG